MAKTVTVRLDESTYELIRKAAAGERRSISNFMEYAAVAYLSEESSVSDSEMQEILEDRQLVEELRRGRAEIGKKHYTTVK